MKFCLKNGKIERIENGLMVVPYTEKQGFFVKQEEKTEFITLQTHGNSYCGSFREISFSLSYEEHEKYGKMNIEITNHSEQDAAFEAIGYELGIDSYMTHYPQWNEKFFPTMLRCEKTHLWGYFMSPAGQVLALASKNPVASWHLEYNKIGEDFGHRILNAGIDFFHSGKLPERHPQDLKILKAGSVYTNVIYMIPLQELGKVSSYISEICGLPVIQAEKYTYEKGERLAYHIFSEKPYRIKLILPDGTEAKEEILEQYGNYTLQILTEDKKTAEAVFYCRMPWSEYLKLARKEALYKPQKATTHTESWYGLFSCFLAAKHYPDEEMDEASYACFREIMPLMFDFSSGEPLVIPNRIQNTAAFISLLTDMYEADPAKNREYLIMAGSFAEFLMSKQAADGAYKKDDIHYTCVIYVAKSMLELALAERACDDETLRKKGEEHYLSVQKAVDELVRNLEDIGTEGEHTLEDGMISCSALQISMFALTLPEEKRTPYIAAAEHMLRVHSCLEQKLIPDCRMNGASLRYWEAQYDVMISSNMLNSPHGWSAWTVYAHYYLYRLTGKKEHLICFMNGMGACTQLMSLDGNLRWSFCSQPYVRAPKLVPDYDKPVKDGYQTFPGLSSAYRGKYETTFFGEEYIDMISGWFRTGENKRTGGYSFCPLYLADETLYVDNQGGCCDNDVHEIFKCMEETVLNRAFLHENEDGTFLTYGCKLQQEKDVLIINTDADVVFYSLQKEHIFQIGDEKQSFSGFGEKEINRTRSGKNG